MRVGNAMKAAICQPIYEWSPSAGLRLSLWCWKGGDFGDLSRTWRVLLAGNDVA